MNKLIRLFPYLLLATNIVLSSCGSDKIEEIDCDTFGPTLQVSEVVNAGCSPTGSITVSTTGGYGELSYSLDGIAFQSSPTFDNLSGNDYTVEVMDSEGCSDVIMVAVGNDSSDLGFTTATTTGGCRTGEGSITVTATGGAGDYTYRLGTGNYVANNTFENVSGGSYNVSVKDADDCITNGTVRVLSGISFTATVKPIIDNNCNITACHGSDPSLIKLTTFSDISGNSARIRTQVSNGTMPPEDKLTQNQTDQILCWIGDGAMNN